MQGPMLSHLRFSMDSRFLEALGEKAGPARRPLKDSIFHRCLSVPTFRLPDSLSRA